MTKRDGFVFYESFYDAIRYLPDDIQLTVYKMLCEYALYGAEPETDDNVAQGFFKLMKPQIDANVKRRENGSKATKSEPKPNLDVTKEGANPNLDLTKEGANLNLDVGGTEPNPNLDLTKPEPKDKVKEKVKEKDKYKAKDKDKAKEKVKEREKGFRPPSLDEVTAYCQERHNNVNPERFIDFYAAKGWMIGANKMRDWKAAIRTWEQREDKPLLQGRGSPVINKPATGRAAVDELLAEMEAIDI